MASTSGGGTLARRLIANVRTPFRGTATDLLKLIGTSATGSPRVVSEILSGIGPVMEAFGWKIWQENEGSGNSKKKVWNVVPPAASEKSVRTADSGGRLDPLSAAVKALEKKHLSIAAKVSLMEVGMEGMRLSIPDARKVSALFSHKDEVQASLASWSQKVCDQCRKLVVESEHRMQQRLTGIESAVKVLQDTSDWSTRK